MLISFKKFISQSSSSSEAKQKVDVNSSSYSSYEQLDGETNSIGTGKKHFLLLVKFTIVLTIVVIKPMIAFFFLLFSFDSYEKNGDSTGGGVL